MKAVKEPHVTEMLAEAEAQDVLLVAGGLSLLVLGVGLIMTNAGIRRTLVTTISRAVPDLEEPLRKGIAGLLPDVERYLHMRSM